MEEKTKATTNAAEAHQKGTLAEITVEIASQDDFQKIAEFYDVVVEENTGTQYDVLWRRDLHPSDESIRKAIDNQEHYVAWKGSNVVAAAVVNHDFANGYETQPWHIDATDEEALCIHLFATHPHFQKQGIGKAFLEGIISLAREEGAKTLRLDVLSYNTPACKLYESVGFEFVSRCHLSYEDQEVSKLDFLMYEFVL